MSFSQGFGMRQSILAGRRKTVRVGVSSQLENGDDFREGMEEIDQRASVAKASADDEM
jgi:hypothetical protein